MKNILSEKRIKKTIPEVDIRVAIKVEAKVVRNLCQDINRKNPLGKKRMDCHRHFYYKIMLLKEIIPLLKAKPLSQINQIIIKLLVDNIKNINLNNYQIIFFRNSKVQLDH